jgi:uncharacterized membrane protein YphA (DoxX/SURF4 family)
MISKTIPSLRLPFRSTGANVKWYVPSTAEEAAPPLMIPSGKRHPAITVLYHILRIGLGLMFVAASWDKILDPGGFARIIQNYQILPSVWVNWVAIVLPWIEALCGLALITRIMERGGLLVSNGLMLTFTLALAWNAYRGVDTECGCFSVAVKGEKGYYLEYILRDVAVLAAGAWVFWHRLKMGSDTTSLWPAWTRHG